MKFSISNIRYTGSKSKLNPWIENIINKHSKNYKSFADIFAGTGTVSAHNIKNYDEIILIVILHYNNLIYFGFFQKGIFNKKKLVKFEEFYQNLNPRKIEDNYFSINFGNKFFQIEDAKKIGYIREHLIKSKSDLTKKEYSILLASLLYSADRSANTVGHYDAYRKIKNIKSKFSYKLIEPMSHNSNIKIFREDANDLVKKISTDITYIDPPYNSRQYSRFYHVLENLTEWKKPDLFGVALKPEPQNMSDYCRNSAYDKFSDLIENINSSLIIVSYNNTYKSKSSSSKNKITHEQISATLKKKGKTYEYSKSHNHFNAGKTVFSDHREYIFVTEVKRK